MAASPTSATGTSPASAATGKKGYFIGDNGENYTFTFFLVASLFLLWGLCNSMIDVMDKHFQDLLHLTKAQSAWVQFAHYMGYTIMALPAGLVTRKMGYKGGIIFGLAFVSVGGFWFWPATQISQFWAFLMGVCLIAMGLTVLETVANPYTTVLGPKEYGAFRINLAQTFNGVGWIFGPFLGAQFFYAVGGAEAANKTLYIPYVGIGFIVLVLAALFFFSSVPEIKTKDEYHTDDATAEVAAADRTGRIPASINPTPSGMNSTTAENFMRSAIAPTMSAGVMMANINWYIEKTLCDTQPP